jgi:hypothetical protein
LQAGGCGIAPEFGALVGALVRSSCGLDLGALGLEQWFDTDYSCCDSCGAYAS